MERMLQSEEAARRLGVKVSTLYAYVSRGLLASHSEPDGRRSLFALADIEHLARRRRTGSRVESGLATVTTGVKVSCEATTPPPAETRSSAAWAAAAGTWYSSTPTIRMPTGRRWPS